MGDRRPARIAALREAIHAAHIDALVLTSLPNVRYLTGFSGSSALVLVTQRDLHFITDFRYDTQVAEEAGDLATIRIEGRGPRTGWPELPRAGILEHAVRDEGSEDFPFATIVASGPRAALPHARASAREIESGDLLLLDFGAQYKGYCSDVTRTMVVGRATSEQREIYEIVRHANAVAAKSVRAGMKGQEADGLARRYIEEKGFGAAFGHSLGHGLGLEVHEAPRLAKTVETLLGAGAVVTIEPGIYRPGWGGVRIEDDVHLAPSGPEILTDFTRELVEVG